MNTTAGIGWRRSGCGRQAGRNSWTIRATQHVNTVGGILVDSENRHFRQDFQPKHLARRNLRLVDRFSRSLSTCARQLLGFGRADRSRWLTPAQKPGKPVNQVSFSLGVRVPTRLCVAFSREQTCSWNPPLPTRKLLSEPAVIGDMLETPGKSHGIPRLYTSPQISPRSMRASTVCARDFCSEPTCDWPPAPNSRPGCNFRRRPSP